MSQLLLFFPNFKCCQRHSNSNPWTEDPLVFYHCHYYWQAQLHLFFAIFTHCQRCLDSNHWIVDPLVNWSINVTFALIFCQIQPVPEALQFKPLNRGSISVLPLSLLLASSVTLILLPFLPIARGVWIQTIELFWQLYVQSLLL
jgi:hypothetical protein